MGLVATKPSKGTVRPAKGAAAAALFCLVLVRCSPEREVFVYDEAWTTGGGLGSGGSQSGAFAGGAAGAATQAAAGGSTGSGGTGIIGGMSGGGGSSIPSSGGTATIGGAPCDSHGDCGRLALCGDGRCAPCEPDATVQCSVDDCLPGFSAGVIARNGCAVCECLAPSECAGDSDCPLGEMCYRGAQCPDGCDSLACCFGNQCSTPGCADPLAGVSCVDVGCPGGSRCLAACDAVDCECDGAEWECDPEPSLCPSACVAP